MSAIAELENVVTAAETSLAETLAELKVEGETGTTLTARIEGATQKEQAFIELQDEAEPDSAAFNLHVAAANEEKARARRFTRDREKSIARSAVLMSKRDAQRTAVDVAKTVLVTEQTRQDTAKLLNALRLTAERLTPLIEAAQARARGLRKPPTEHTSGCEILSCPPGQTFAWAAHHALSGLLRHEHEARVQKRERVLNGERNARLKVENEKRALNVYEEQLVAVTVEHSEYAKLMGKARDGGKRGSENVFNGLADKMRVLGERVALCKKRVAAAESEAAATQRWIAEQSEVGAEVQP